MIASLAALAALQTAVHEPKAGTKERKAILDGLRPYVQRRIGGKIEFKVEWLRSNGEHAFVDAIPQRPGGRAIDYSRTRYADLVREGVFGGGVDALMRRKGKTWIPDEAWIGPTDEAWIGPTDVAWDGIWTRRGLPRGLFPGG